METRNISLNTNLPTISFAIVCLALLGSCGNASLPPQVDHAVMASAPPPPPAAADSMHLYDSTYTRLKIAMDSNFRASAEKRLLGTEQELSWAAFAEHVPSDAAPLHGVVVEYGLSKETLQLGVSYVRLNATSVPDSFVFTPATVIYNLSNGALKTGPAAAWRLNYQYDPSSSNGYFGNVRVRRTSGGAFSPVNHASDPHSATFPWETEMKQLHDQNDGHTDSTLYVVIRAIGRTDDKGDLVQGIAFNMRLRANNNPTGAYRDLLNNTRTADSMLLMHAGDFGSLCPNDCARYMAVPQ